MVLNILLVSKESLGIKFLSSPVHNKKYIKTKIKEYDRVIKTNALLLLLLWEWIKNYPQVYLE